MRKYIRLCGNRYMDAYNGYFYALVDAGGEMLVTCKHRSMAHVLNALVNRGYLGQTEAQRIYDKFGYMDAKTLERICSCFDCEGWETLPIGVKNRE